MWKMNSDGKKAEKWNVGYGDDRKEGVCEGSLSSPVKGGRGKGREAKV